ncbi:hypothetical protein HHE03_06090 [Helicobacter heilmannii]|nr:hypothetical protein HHE03_06090 [Helicobacter heilmannii]
MKFFGLSNGAMWWGRATYLICVSKLMSKALSTLAKKAGMLSSSFVLICPKNAMPLSKIGAGLVSVFVVLSRATFQNCLSGGLC